MTIPEVVERLEELALLLELKGENPFKIRAYTNGARSLEAFEGDLAEAVATGALKQVKGIGAGLFADIKTLVETGELPVLDTLRAETPAGLLELVEIPGLGPKKVKAVYEGLGIANVGELEYACLENRLVGLPGFGEKTQAKILASIERWKRNRGFHLYADVVDEAEALETALATLPAVTRGALAGDVRRQAEVVRRISLVAGADDPAATLAAFKALPAVERVLEEGGDLCAVCLRSGVEAELAVVAPAAFPAALLHHTGNAGFLEDLGAHAQSRGLRLTAEALLAADGQPLALADEAALFAALDLAEIPPELREGRGEVAAAQRRALPSLVVEADLQGIFHVHTRYSDGEATVRDMVMSARTRGYRYIGISDHSEAAFYAHGLTRERIAEQQAEIRALNEELDDITVLSGIEADILADGSLDYDETTLATFDFVIGSVHSRFGQDREAMTRRLVNALSHPRLTILGHMTGRLLLSRDAYDFDLDAVLQAAATHGKVIELNANPHRLDIDWRDLAEAKRLGIPIAINPDAHSPKGLAHTRFGVACARKGGLEAGQVFNTRPLEAVLAHLRR